MKKIQTILCGSLAVLALAACSSDDNEILGGNEPQQQGAPTYTVTTEAVIGGGAETRALDESGTTITATFATTEDVYVYNASNGYTLLGGTLKPQADGASATLKGSLTGTIANGNSLTLIYPKSTINYTGQNGLLTGTNSIAEKYDFAKATVTVSDATTPSVTTSAATFTSQQAITKFTFTDGTNPVNVKSLTISGTGLVQSVAADGTVTNGDIDVTLDEASTTVYVAMSNNSGAKQTYTFTATDASDKTYTGTKAANLANGKNYTASVTLTPAVVLTSGTGDKELRDGDIVTGTGGANTHVTIAEGATVTLHNVTLTDINDYDNGWAGITCAGDATIILSGTNAVKGGYEEYPGIYVPEGSTLTIQGDGSLDASSNGYGAGIGGGFSIGCGNIVIEGGNITANGGYAAGIGAGAGASCGNITISGGSVTATCGSQGAGIGTGAYGTCGNIYISGGTVTATGGNYAAGIGAGDNGTCGDITITSGVTSVTATKGDDAPNSIGAGAGDGGTCGTVTIEPGANVIQN